MISWNLGMFVLSIAYSSCLYSLIAAPSHSMTIDTIKQLFNAIHSGQIIATSLDEPRYIEYFQVCLAYSDCNNFFFKKKFIQNK